jgi:hypothetical protein
MKILGSVVRLSLKSIVIIAMIIVVLILASAVLPMLFPLALLLGMLAILRLCWRMLTPRRESCGHCGTQPR